MAFFDVEPIIKKSSQNEKKEKKVEQIQTYIVEQLEDWVDIMRQNIQIKDYPNGWFGKHLRCAKGCDIFNWILQHAEEDQEKGGIICQKMLEKSLIQAVEEGKGTMFKKKFNVNNLYRFFMDRDDIADNQVKKWKDEPGDPIEVTMNLVSLIIDVYQKAIVFDDEEGDGEQMLDVEPALKSQEYKKYINACSEL